MGSTSKNGRGNPFQSNFGATKDTENFQFFTQCLKNTQQVYSRTGTRYIFFYIFIFSIFVNNRYEWIKIFIWCYLYFEFQIKKTILIFVKSPTEFLCFSLLWIINTEKLSFLLMCSVKKNLLENGCL